MEYEVYRVTQDALPQAVDRDFADAIDGLGMIEGESKLSTTKSGE